MNQQNYNLHQWHNADPQAPKLFFHHYFMRGNEFTNWQLHNVVHGPSGKTRFRHYVWTNVADSAQAFRVDIAESPTVDDARNQFQELLQENMRPLRESVRGLLGSDSYVNHPDQMHAGIFSIANIVISVSTVGKVNIACNQFLKKIYGSLLEIPKEARSSSTANISDVFSAEAGQEVHAGQSTSLIFGTRAWYKLVLDGPGKISSQDDRLQYLSEEKGKALITLYTYKDHAVEKDSITLNVI